MIVDVVSGWMFAYSGHTDGQVLADLTLTLPTRTGFRVYAEMMLTSLSQGISIEQGRVGSTGTRIVRGTVMGPSGIQFVDLPADPANNAAYFNNCLAVDFRLGCDLSTAYVNANVWIYGMATQRKATYSRLTVEVTEKKSKQVKYTHSYVAVATNLPKAEEAQEEALKRATRLLDLKRSQLGVRAAEDAGKGTEVKRRVKKGEPRFMQLP